MRVDEFPRCRRIVVRGVALELDGLDVSESQLEMLEEDVRPRKLACELFGREGVNLLLATQRTLGILEITHLPFLEQPMRAPDRGDNPLLRLVSSLHACEHAC